MTTFVKSTGQCIPLPKPVRLSKAMWEKLPELIRRRTFEPKSALRGCIPHRELAPELAYGRHRGPAPRYAHLSAVLIAMVPTANGDWSIPLTLRSKNLTDHGGQVSLPGGRSDAGETTWQTATREFGEELGSNIETILPVGQLHPIFVYASRHVVQPMIGVCTQTPAFTPNPAEVDELIFLSLRDLISDDSIKLGLMQKGTTNLETPGFRVGEHFIWGATAMILGELRSVVREIDTMNNQTTR